MLTMSKQNMPAVPWSFNIFYLGRTKKFNFQDALYLHIIYAYAYDRRDDENRL